MTFIWLLVWLCSDTPGLHAWNNWLIALLICVGLDFFGGSRVRS